jgi:hypothetical protein
MFSSLITSLTMNLKSFVKKPELLNIASRIYGLSNIKKKIIKQFIIIEAHGYSGILYVEYDELVHQPTVFVGPWNDPINDTTQLAFAPDAKEGVMYMVPSVLLHYAQPNPCHKDRVVTSWDMLVR